MGLDFNETSTECTVAVDSAGRIPTPEYSGAKPLHRARMCRTTPAPIIEEPHWQTRATTASPMRRPASTSMPQPHGGPDQAIGAGNRAAGRGCRDRRLWRPVRPQAGRFYRSGPGGHHDGVGTKVKIAIETGVHDTIASTSSPCRSTTSWCRARNRFFSSIFCLWKA